MPYMFRIDVMISAYTEYAIDIDCMAEIENEYWGLHPHKVRELIDFIQPTYTIDRLARALKIGVRMGTFRIIGDSFQVREG